MQLNILVTIGTYEIELAAERQIGGKITKVKKGIWTHGGRPYSYNRNKDKSLSINEEEANTIREVYNLYLNGYRSVQIAHLLNSRGVNSPASIKANKRKELTEEMMDVPALQLKELFEECIEGTIPYFV